MRVLIQSSKSPGRRAGLFVIMPTRNAYKGYRIQNHVQRICRGLRMYGCPVARQRSTISFNNSKLATSKTLCGNFLAPRVPISYQHNLLLAILAR
jgi:hypothetical protein